MGTLCTLAHTHHTASLGGWWAHIASETTPPPPFCAAAALTKAAVLLQIVPMPISQCLPGLWDSDCKGMCDNVRRAKLHARTHSRRAHLQSDFKYYQSFGDLILIFKPFL